MYHTIPSIHYVHTSFYIITTTDCEHSTTIDPASNTVSSTEFQSSGAHTNLNVHMHSQLTFAHKIETTLNFGPFRDRRHPRTIFPPTTPSSFLFVFYHTVNKQHTTFQLQQYQYHTICYNKNVQDSFLCVHLLGIHLVGILGGPHNNPYRAQTRTTR